MWKFPINRAPPAVPDTFGETSALPLNQEAEAWWKHGVIPLGEALKQSLKLATNR
jgi:hypothetical protein